MGLRDADPDVGQAQPADLSRPQAAAAGQADDDQVREHVG
jgi:hypothetical protein